MPRKHPTPGFSSHDPLLDAPVARSLDLHGLTAAEATPAVEAFLKAAARTHPGRVVRIITGKGRGSNGAAVLKPKVARLLKGPLSAVVRDWTLDVDEGSYLVQLR